MQRVLIKKSQLDLICLTRISSTLKSDLEAVDPKVLCKRKGDVKVHIIKYCLALFLGHLVREFHGPRMRVLTE